MMLQSSLTRAERPAESLGWFDDILSRALPGWACKRAKARAYMRLYDAAQPSQYHKSVVSGGFSGDAVMQNAGIKLRSWARYLDENHDLSIGILDTLVGNIVGTGLTIEPMAMTTEGDLHEELNNAMRDLWRDFWTRPEMTRELPGAECERLLCRTWMRDGESLTQHVEGANNVIRHPHAVPYSIELIEADLLPFELSSRFLNNIDNVTHGVQKNAWGQPLNYLLYKHHPGDVTVNGTGLGISFNFADIKVVPASQIIHLKLVRRFRQTRGVPILHGVIQRLADIKDYEESERIAARVCASWTGFITRSADAVTSSDAAAGTRNMEMAAGMIFDNLLPGEKPEMIGATRPNTGLGEFRADMMRAAASGTGTNFSSISKNYNGTYSAQRQEMVESRPGYQRMTNYFIDSQMMPVWKRFVSMAITAGLIRIPANVIDSTVYRALMRGPGLPWIDPKKEIEADVLAIQNRIKSLSQVIRERGGDPSVVLKEIKKDSLLFGETAQPNAPVSTSEQDAAALAAEQAAA